MGTRHHWRERPSHRPGNALRLLRTRRLQPVAGSRLAPKSVVHHDLRLGANKKPQSAFAVQGTSALEGGSGAHCASADTIAVWQRLLHWRDFRHLSRWRTLRGSSSVQGGAGGAQLDAFTLSRRRRRVPNGVTFRLGLSCRTYGRNQLVWGAVLGVSPSARPRSSLRASGRGRP